MSAAPGPPALVSGYAEWSHGHLRLAWFSTTGRRPGTEVSQVPGTVFVHLEEGTACATTTARTSANTSTNTSA